MRMLASDPFWITPGPAHVRLIPMSQLPFPSKSVDCHVITPLCHVYAFFPLHVPLGEYSPFRGAKTGNSGL